MTGFSWKTRWYVAVVLIALSFIVQPLSIKPSFGGEDDVVKIGSPTPYSGVYAEASKLVAGGEDLAVKQWNDQGGVLGKKLVMLREDTQQLPAVAARKARKLFQEDGINVLLGAAGSNVAAAELDIARKLKRLFIIHVAYSSELTGKDCNYYTVRIGHNSLIEAAAFGAWMVKNFGKTYYFIAADYLWGTSTTEDFIAAVEKAGGKTLGKTYFPLGAKDLSPYFASIKQAKPEVLFTVAAGNDARLALTQIHQFGLDKEMKIAGPAPLFGAEILSTVGEAAEGIVGASPWHAVLDTPASQKFVADYKAFVGEEPPLYAMHGYAGVDLYVQAVQQAGTTDTDAVIKTMRGFTYHGPQGVNYIRPEDNQAMMDFYIMTVKQGKVQILERVPRESYSVPSTCQKDLSKAD
jgi:branched-chain amino acid transport system substrate-binding protein